MARNMYFGGFRIKLRCKGCERPVAINGPVDKIHCPHCDGPAQIDPQLLGTVLDHYSKGHPGYDDAPPGVFINAHTGVRANYWRQRPQCRACGKRLNTNDIPEDTPGEAVCRCGEVHQTFPIPAWLNKTCPQAALCIDGDQEALQPEGPKGEASAIYIACAQCGGGIKVARQTKRATLCTFCNCQVMVPDPVWERLHPVPKVRRWYVGFRPRTKKKSRGRAE